MNILHKPFRYTFINSTLIIVLINIAVFFLTSIFSGLDSYLGLSVAGCLYYHFWWQPVTYMFTHAGISHILFNMLTLYIFGISVERAIGSKEFLLLYFFCGIFDGLISLLLYYLTGQGVLLVGASGAIYSILLVYAVLFPRSIISIWGIIPVPAPILVVIFAVIELGSQFTGLSMNVAHLTHLTGFALGWLYLVVRMGIHPIRVWKDAYRK